MKLRPFHNQLKVPHSNFNSIHSLVFSGVHKCYQVKQKVQILFWRTKKELTESLSLYIYIYI